MTRIAYLVTSAREMTLADGSPHPTGYFAEEALKPYERFVAAGFDVTVITPDGKPPYADPYGLSWFFHYPEAGQGLPGLGRPHVRPRRGRHPADPAPEHRARPGRRPPPGRAAAGRRLHRGRRPTGSSARPRRPRGGRTASSAMLAENLGLADLARRGRLAPPDPRADPGRGRRAAGRQRAPGRRTPPQAAGHPRLPAPGRAVRADRRGHRRVRRGVHAGRPRAHGRPGRKPRRRAPAGRPAPQARPDRRAVPRPGRAAVRARTGRRAVAVRRLPDDLVHRRGGRPDRGRPARHGLAARRGAEERGRRLRRRSLGVGLARRCRPQPDHRAEPGVDRGDRRCGHQEAPCPRPPGR